MVIIMNKLMTSTIDSHELFIFLILKIKINAELIIRSSGCVIINNE
jgi:hypothetical protein